MNCNKHIMPVAGGPLMGRQTLSAQRLQWQCIGMCFRGACVRAGGGGGVSELWLWARARPRQPLMPVTDAVRPPPLPASSGLVGGPAIAIVRCAPTQRSVRLADVSACVRAVMTSHVQEASGSCDSSPAAAGIGFLHIHRPPRLPGRRAGPGCAVLGCACVRA